MSIQRKLRSRILNVLFNPTVVRFRRWLSDQRRRLSGDGHVVSVFLQIDDPYSYILSRYLPSLAEHYDIELRLYLSKAKGDEFQPAPEMLVEYAIADCKRLALEFGIPFLDKGSLPPTGPVCRMPSQRSLVRMPLPTSSTTPLRLIGEATRRQLRRSANRRASAASQKHSWKRQRKSRRSWVITTARCCTTRASGTGASIDCIT